MPVPAAHFDGVHGRAASLFLQVRGAAVPELLHVEHGIEGAGGVDVAELAADAFGELAVVRAGLAVVVAGGAGERVVAGEALVAEELFAEGGLGGVHRELVRQGLERLVGACRRSEAGSVMGGAGLLHPVEDDFLVGISDAAAPVHGGELGGRHGLVLDDPFHLGKGGFAHRLVLRGINELSAEIHGAQAVLEVLFDDGLDARDLGVEGQVVVAGMAGHALVEHDVRHFGEFLHLGLCQDFLFRRGLALRGKAGDEGCDEKASGGEKGVASGHGLS